MIARPLPIADIEDHDALRTYVRAAIEQDPVEMRTLHGGVSNRVVWVRLASGDEWVFKQALEKLRVAVDWRSRPERAHQEAVALKALRTLAPAGVVPDLLLDDKANHLLAMRAVPLQYPTWKRKILGGGFALWQAERFGRILGRIHVASSHEIGLLPPELSDRTYFESLRLEPYYTYAASKVSEARRSLDELVAETRLISMCLIHGDYSPKNVILLDDRMVLLDFEVAHVGDPAFDIGFGLTHLLSKANHLEADRAHLTAGALRFWDAYRSEAADLSGLDAVERRAVRHTLACLLARVEGRSPLEYLSPAAAERQRAAALALMASQPPSIPVTIHEFVRAL